MRDIKRKLARMFNTSPSTIKEQETAPFNLKVASENPVEINFSPEAGISIATAIRANISNMPKDDFMLADISTRGENQGESSMPQEPCNLPEISENLPSQEFFKGIEWQQVKNLPGYAVSQIRKMGRDIFSSFDCFRSLGEEVKRQGKDPLGEVLIVNEWTHDWSTTNFLANMIGKSGVMLDTGCADFGNRLPGYRPELIVMMSQNWTFMLVRERFENNSPVDLNTVYAWRGGLNHYGPEKMEGRTVPDAIPLQHNWG